MILILPKSKSNPIFQNTPSSATWWSMIRLCSANFLNDACGITRELPSLSTAWGIRCIAVAWCLCSASILTAAQDDNAQASTAKDEVVSAEQAEFVRSKVVPILESRCYECHGDQEAIEGDLRVTSLESLLTGGESGPAIVPGDPDRSFLIQAIRYENFQMPPRNKIPDEEIEVLVQWVRDGAPWPKGDAPSVTPMKKAEFPLQERIAAHWAWKKIERPVVPSPANQAWATSDTDRLLIARLEAAGLSPAPDADRRVLLRRICFDLTGLPPSIELQTQFFNDPAPTSEAAAKLIDQLLSTPQFGERWGRHWLDLVRYAETLGHEFDFPLPHAWRYRDYVIRALNADVPYNQFVREHLAGDLLENPRLHPETGTNESIVATGFWYLCEDKHAPVDVRLEEAMRIDNQIDVFGKTFLGLTISCARCHDHKFDAITTEDYYALSGFLQSSRRRVEWLDSGNQQKTLIHEIREQRSAADAALVDGLKPWNADALRTLVYAAFDDAAPVQAPVTPELRDKLRSVLKDASSQAPADALSLLARMMQKPSDASDRNVAAAWMAETRAEADRQVPPAGDSVPKWERFADLRNGVPSDWFAWGQAFEDFAGATRAPGPVAVRPALTETIPVALSTGTGFNQTLPASGYSWTWQQDSCVPSTGRAVSSASIAPVLRGSLHSPEWELRSPEVLILAAGRNSRVRLVIDGYVMYEFSDLLFSGIRQPIETDGQFRWIRLAGDLHRYIGHRCHLEFLDEGDGWFAVKEVRFVQPGQSFDVPVESVNSALIIAETTDRNALIDQWVTTIQNDRAWPQLALSLGLVSADAQTQIQTAVNRWKELATRPVGGDPVLVMCDGSGEEEHVFVRGNHRNPGQEARRRLMTALDKGAPLSQPERSGRLELADRVLAADNPFPARVAVNRVWQQLFGRGIVASSDNFGVLGEQPSHPELLDYLADEFRRDGWSLKRLIRRLMLTRAYAMSSHRTTASDEKDPQNLLLHRANVRRLESETIRDSMLAISGRLDLTQFGPPVPVFLTEFMQGRGRPGQSGPVDGAGRRSIYQAVNRNFLSPFMVTFDTPQPATAVARRSRSNVPAQALILLNNEFVHDQSAVWARRLIAAIPPGEIIETAWRQAFARKPDASEVQSLDAWLTAVAAEQNLSRDEALKNEAVVQDLCHTLLNKKELIFLE